MQDDATVEVHTYQYAPVSRVLLGRALYSLARITPLGVSPFDLGLSFSP